MNILLAIVKKDFKLYLSDRKALIISFAVPVLIATFLGGVLGSASNKPAGSTKFDVLVASDDNGPVTKDIVKNMKESDVLNVKEESADDARKQVKDGKSAIAVIFPKDFGKGAVSAMAGGAKPKLDTVTDPAKSMETMAVKGALTQSVMRAVSKAAFGDTGERAARLPYEIQDVPQSAPETEAWSGSAHAFAGMGMQGLLFWGIELAMGLMREKREGIWKRLRAAPTSPSTQLLGRGLSSWVRGLAVLVATFTVGFLVFHFSIKGSVVGFGLICLAAAAMTSGFGLFVAALGRTEEQSRGLAILAVLMMMMIGGGWFPSFLMPGWVQNVAKATPVKWAVDGFDGVMWRGWGLEAALPAVGVLLGFAAIFSAIAYRRFQWES